MCKDDIYSILNKTEKEIDERISSLKNRASILDYSHLVREEDGVKIWTDAIQEALLQNEIIEIPYSCELYYIDKTLLIPKNTRIVADSGAVIKRTKDFRLVMLRNENNADGSDYPEKDSERDMNISIEGGIWDGDCGEYCHTPYDEEGNYFGVNATIFFNHLDGLSVKNVTVRNSGEFSIQVGDLQGAIFENIRFVDCHADGVHINGNTQKIIVRNISGQVGDDLVALNAFDWERSSVNFGAISYALCENLALSEDSNYKAMRILPGRYTYKDGTASDCKIENVIIKNVRGINTFKGYFQRDRHLIEENPTYGAQGRFDNVFFEDIDVTITEPIDKMDAYVENNPVNGHFAAFELGSEIGYMSFENIKVTIDKQRSPMSFFITIGAKSIRYQKWEIFDPQIGAVADKIELRNILINGEIMQEQDADKYVCQIVFDDIYKDGRSSSIGKIKELVVASK